MTWAAAGDPPDSDDDTDEDAEAGEVGAQAAAAVAAGAPPPPSTLLEGATGPAVVLRVLCSGLSAETQPVLGMEWSLLYV
jgi:hypothetical protein